MAGKAEPITRLALIGAAAAGAVGVFVLATLPVEQALSHFVIDDMGYYLTAARQVVAGHPPSLDGVNPTNGFHPLWLLVLIGVQKFFGSTPELVVHLALTILAAAFVATGVLLVSCVYRHAAHWLAIPFAAWFFCNYRLASIPLGGLESAFAGLTVVVAAVLELEWAGRLTPAKAAMLGTALGLAYLARFDALLFGVVAVGWLVFLALRDRSWSQLQFAVLTGAVSACWLIPWTIFSWRAVHQVLPRSGEALQTWRPSVWDPPWTASRLLEAFRAGVVPPAGDVANLIGAWPSVNAFGMVHRSGALALAIVCVLSAALLWSVRRDSRVRAMLWMLVYAVLHTAYYVHFAVSIRYLYPAVLLTALVLVTAAGAAWRNSPSRGALTANIAALAAVIVAAVSGVQAWHSGIASHSQHDMVSAAYVDIAPWVTAHVEPDATLGSFNAGMFSYFGRQKHVNLDGVMNDGVIAALRDGWLCDYIDGQKIDYLVDNDLAIEYFFDRDRSCVRQDWRGRWRTVHRVLWPPNRTVNQLAVVVVKRTS